MQQMDFLQYIKHIVKDKRGFLQFAIPAIAGIASAVIGKKSSDKAAKQQERQADLARQQEQETLAKQEEIGIKTATALRERLAQLGSTFPTVTETQQGQQLAQSIQDRIAGRGLEELVKPEADIARANLQQHIIPRISSEASARGLGRSTIPVGQIGQASQAVEQDIQRRVAELRTQAFGQQERLAFGEAGDLQAREQQRLQGEQIAGALEIPGSTMNISRSLTESGSQKAEASLRNAEVVGNALSTFGGALGDILDNIINSRSQYGTQNKLTGTFTAPNGQTFNYR